MRGFCAFESEFAPKFKEFSAEPEFVAPKLKAGVLLFTGACDEEPKAKVELLLLSAAWDVGVKLKPPKPEVDV